MDQRIRAYDAGRDLDAVVRTWTEIGWIDGADKAAALQAFLAAGNAEVGLMEEEAECMVHWVPGSIHYDTTPLPLCAITAVTTSRVARKQGLASSMTSRALAQGADAGCAVAALGMFEQGFYDRFGFGTAAYEQYFSFDPSALMVDHIPYRPPQRIDVSQWADMHRAMAGRMTAHGSVVLGPPEIIEGEVGFGNNPFGLGYRDDTGSLTHFVFGELEGEHGPWRIDALAYESAHQLLELLRLIHELGDQIRSVMLREPPHVQLQVLLADPFRERNRSRGSSHESFARSVAWWQLRILDLDACVRARTWAGTPVRFNLELTDPIEERLTVCKRLIIREPLALGGPRGR